MVSTTDNEQISIRSQFMQNYRLASPVSATATVLPTPTVQEDVELFTIGSNGALYNIYPDQTADTGWSMVNLQFPSSRAMTAAAALIPSRTLTRVWACDTENNLYFLDADDHVGGPKRWRNFAWQSLDLPTPGCTVQNLQATQDATGNPIIMASVSGLGTGQCALYILQNDGWSPLDARDFMPPEGGFVTFAISIVDLTTINQPPTQGATWCESAIEGNPPLLCSQAYGDEIFGCTTSGTYYTAISTVLNAAGYSEVFAISSASSLYYMATTSDAQYYAPILLSQQVTVKALAAGARSSGTILEVFGLGTDGTLYHAMQLPVAPTDSGWSELVPIDTTNKYVQIASTQNPQGYTDVFAVTNAAQLVHIWADQLSGDWTIEEVATSQRFEIERLSGYQAVITAYNSDGTPAVNSNVLLSADEALLLDINNKVVIIDSLTPWEGVTNPSGQLIVALNGESIGVPLLYVTPQFLPSPTKVAVDLSAPIQDTLSGLTVTALRAAQWIDDAGNRHPVVPPGTDDETVATLVENTVLVMGLARIARHEAPAAIRPYLHRRHDHRVTRTPKRHPRQPLRVPAFTPWRVTISPTGMTFAYLTNAEADEVLAQMRRRRRPRYGIDFDISWGDFVQTLEDGANAIESFIVTPLNGAIATIFDLAQGTYQHVVEAVKDLCDLTEVLFDYLKDKAEDTYQKFARWLGFVLNWNDIVRTHKVINYAIGQGLDFLPAAMTAFQTFIDTSIQNLEGLVNKEFDSIVAKVFGSETLIGAGSSYQNGLPDDVQDAWDNDVVSSAYRNNLHGVSPGNPGQSANMSGLLQVSESLVDLVIDKTNLYEATQAFLDAQNYFQEAADNPAQLVQNTIAAFLSVAKGVILAGLAIAQDVIDAILELVSSLWQGLRSVLIESWDIPLVSDLYKLYVGDDLNAQSLLSFVIAAPTTVVFKVMFDRAPFPDDNSVANFQSRFTTQALVNAMNGSVVDSSQPVLTGDALIAYNLAGTIAMGVEIGVDTLLDAVQAGYVSIPGRSGGLLQRIILAHAGFLTFLQIPWVSVSGSMVCTSAPGWAMALWSLGGSTMLLSVAWYAYRKVTLRYDDLLGVVALSVVGAFESGLLVMRSWYSTGNSMQLSYNYRDAFWIAPQLFAALRMPAAQEDPPKWGIIALTCIDGVSEYGCLAAGISALVVQQTGLPSGAGTL